MSLLAIPPCSQEGSAHWLIGAYGRWEADDNQGNNECYTHHRVWVDYPCPSSSPPSPTEFAGVASMFPRRTHIVTCPPGLVISEFTAIGEGSGWALLHAQPCYARANLMRMPLHACVFRPAHSCLLARALLLCSGGDSGVLFLAPAPELGPVPVVHWSPIVRGLCGR